MIPCFLHLYNCLFVSYDLLGFSGDGSDQLGFLSLRNIGPFLVSVINSC